MYPLVRKQRSNHHLRPFLIIWETTRACDLACRHCRAEAQPRAAPGLLDSREGKRLLEQAAQFGSPPSLFIFTGGDPFKREDLFSLVRHAADIGLAPAVSPSATPLLNRENLVRLKNSGAKAISLSLDASTPELHDSFRQVPGSYALTMSGWRVAREIKLKVQINTTVTRHNLKDLARIFRLVQEYGAFTWSLFFLVPTGRGLTRDQISPPEYEAVMHFLYDASKLISTKTTEGHHFKRVVMQRSILEERGLALEDYTSLDPIYSQLRNELGIIVKENKLQMRRSVIRTPMHLNAGDGMIFISQTGEVFPSGFLPLSAGNIRERSLVDIYRWSPLLRQLRSTKQLGGRCGRCEFASVCGGSRSRAYAVTGDPLAEEPYCTYLPGTFPFQKDLAMRLRNTVS